MRTVAVNPNLSWPANAGHPAEDALGFNETGDSSTFGTWIASPGWPAFAGHDKRDKRVK
jgi:hypothetical protein